jgi:hypothetical protein
MQGADIVVFPEYGVTGPGMFSLPLAKFEAYCQTIPEPGATEATFEVTGQNKVSTCMHKEWRTLRSQFSEICLGTDVMILKILSPKKLRNIGIFDSKQSHIMQNFDHNIGF